MNTKIAFATATAMGLLMGTAWAGGSNTLYLTQKGTGNQATVKQQLGNDSDIGQSGNTATQDGTRNRLGFEIGWGTNNDNDIVNFTQKGIENLFEMTAAGNSGKNTLGSFLQNGKNNSARIWETSNSNSSVDDVSIVGDRNTVTIQQGNSVSTSSWNTVRSVSIKGDDNGIAGSYPYAHGDGTAGVFIQQLGVGNTVSESSIVGSNNRDASPWAPGAFNRVHEIIQNGSGNGNTLSVASTKGSNGNWIRVSEQGNSNNFSVRQGVNSASTGNHFKIDQDGSNNTATGTEYGNYNLVNIEQNQDWNNATANITGSSNGGGLFIGDANSVAVSNSLTSGLIRQDGLTNTATLTVVSSDNNQFAFLQKGNNNLINATVKGNGSNSAAVVQTGNWNKSSFTQNGTGNVMAVSQ